MSLSRKGCSWAPGASCPACLETRCPLLPTHTQPESSFLTLCCFKICKQLRLDTLCCQIQWSDTEKREQVSNEAAAAASACGRWQGLGGTASHSRAAHLVLAGKRCLSGDRPHCTPCLPHLRGWLLYFHLGLWTVCC